MAPMAMKIITNNKGGSWIMTAFSARNIFQDIAGRRSQVMHEKGITHSREVRTKAKIGDIMAGREEIVTHQVVETYCEASEELETTRLVQKCLIIDQHETQEFLQCCS